MLTAIMAMYRVTESIVDSAVVTATRGVRQGSPTSCFLFIIFVNELIRAMKEKCQTEPLLEWLHIMVLMDDTVLLSTSRCNMIKKVEVLKQFCEQYGMVINNSKTKFFVINGEEEDKEPLRVDELVIEHCTSYTYLGSPFTSDGSVSSAVKVHVKNKLCHVLKYVSFLKKNNDVPFIVKRRVLDAAMMSSLLYGCESWVGADVKSVSKLYNWAIKQLLGVRRSTSNLVCYAEAGYPSLPDLIKFKQHNFFRNMWLERSGMQDDPLSFAIRTVANTNTHTGKLVQNFIANQPPVPTSLVTNVHSLIANSDSSRCLVYKEINPDFLVHDVYRSRHTINEHHRIEFTRFRVSGHSLAVETGRWNRRGRARLPIEERLCVCGLVQNERHIIESCPLTQNIRKANGIVSMEDLFTGCNDHSKTCRVIYEILRTYT